MKKIIILFITTCALLIPDIRECFGQTITFQKTIAEPEAQYLNSVVQTPDNGYIAVGSKRISPNEYIYIVRFDAFGDTLWTRIIPGDDAMCVIKTIDGYYALCDINGRIFKFDINGNILITGGFYDIDSRVRKLIQNQNGDYFLCGGYFPSYYRPYFLKLNQNGAYQWDSVYSDGFYDGNFEDLKVSNNNIVLTGFFSMDSTFTSNIFLMLVNYNGEKLFFNSGYSQTGVYPEGLIETRTGNFIICGQFRSNNPFIAKYNAQGIFQWIRTYDTVTTESANSILFDHEGNYVYTGSFSNSAYVRIRKTDTNGVEIWKKQYSIQNQQQVGLDIKLTTDSGFVVTGLTGITEEDIYLLKTDKNGDTLTPIGIEPISNTVPNQFKLYQNYPNPFNPVTLIKFEVPADAMVSIKVYDILGKEVFSVREFKKPGLHEIQFDGSNLASGMYFYTLTSGTFIDTKKMVFLK